MIAHSSTETICPYCGNHYGMNCSYAPYPVVIHKPAPPLDEIHVDTWEGVPLRRVRRPKEFSQYDWEFPEFIVTIPTKIGQPKPPHPLRRPKRIRFLRHGLNGW